MFAREVTPEDESEWVRKVAERIKRWQMETVALMVLYTIKPLSHIGGELGRFFVSPFVPLFGEDVEKFFAVFEKTQNIDRLIELLEQRLDGNVQERKILDNDENSEAQKKA